jgi:hypothetical protein
MEETLICIEIQEKTWFFSLKQKKRSFYETL